MDTQIIHPVSYPNSPFVSWICGNIEQVIAFANADDAKMCFQALYFNGIAAHFSVPEGYKEIPLKRYDGDGLLSDAEMEALKTKLDNMTLVR